jgi:hypothetical protein
MVKLSFLSSSDKVLNGEQTLTIVDKDFLSAKEFKSTVLLQKWNASKQANWQLLC